LLVDFLATILRYKIELIYTKTSEYLKGSLENTQYGVLHIDKELAKRAIRNLRK